MPVKELSVSDNGQLRPVTWYGGKGMGDVRTLSAEFLLSLQDLWRRRGDEILERVADQSPGNNAMPFGISKGKIISSIKLPSAFA